MIELATIHFDKFKTLFVTYELFKRNGAIVFKKNSNSFVRFDVSYILRFFQDSWNLTTHSNAFFF